MSRSGSSSGALVPSCSFGSLAWAFSLREANQFQLFGVHEQAYLAWLKKIQCITRTCSADTAENGPLEVRLTEKPAQGLKAVCGEGPRSVGPRSVRAGKPTRWFRRPAASSEAGSARAAARALPAVPPAAPTAPHRARLRPPRQCVFTMAIVAVLPSDIEW